MSPQQHLKQHFLGNVSKSSLQFDDDTSSSSKYDDACNYQQMMTRHHLGGIKYQVFPLSISPLISVTMWSVPGVMLFGVWCS